MTMAVLGSGLLSSVSHTYSCSTTWWHNPTPFGLILLSPGFSFSVLVYIFLQSNTDAISPMMSSLISPSLNRYGTKYYSRVNLALDNIKLFSFGGGKGMEGMTKKGLLQGPSKKNRWLLLQRPEVSDHIKF